MIAILNVDEDLNNLRNRYWFSDERSSSSSEQKSDIDLLEKRTKFWVDFWTRDVIRILM